MIKGFILHIWQKNRMEFALALFAIIGLFVFIPIFTYAYFAQDLTSPDYIMNRNDTGLVLLDRNNKPFFTFYQAKQRQLVQLSQVPQVTQQAIVAAEDKGFYTHPGFSIEAIVRSSLSDLKSGQSAYGGSTITQQLVKNALLTPQKSFLRKYQEIVLASEIERRYNKQQILQMYLNSVYFGEGAFGIEEASERYFDEPASQLDLAQSAILAGILPSPSQLSPLTGDLNGAKERQKYVLSQMVSAHDITPEQEKAAEDEQLVFKSKEDDLNSVGAHFALMVRDQLVQKYGEEQISRSGFKVKTTLDIDMQKYAEQVVKEQVLRLAPDRVSNGAAVVMDPKTGEILTMVGSYDWNDTKFGKVNVALALRQPGSSFKPIVYVDAMEQHMITPATILKDEPTTYKNPWETYTPHDYDGKYRGPVTVRRALANSLNIPAVQVMNMVGVPSAVQEAQKFGLTTITDPSKYGLSLVLGAGEVKLLEHTDVYATFANQGVYNAPQAILQIQDKHDQTVYSYTPNPHQVIEPQYAFLISSILSDNRARAEEFGNALTISRPAAVKTGTTENYRDAWTMGYTPSLAVGVWVGNNDGTLMDNIAGSLGAAPIWRQLMEHFLAGTPVETFQPPLGVVSETICGYGEGIATSSAIKEYFVDGTQPLQPCAVTIPTPSPSSAELSPTPTRTIQTTPTPTLAPVTPTPTTSTPNQPVVPPGKLKKLP